MTRAYVGVGTNVDREINLRSGLQAMRASFGRIEVSRVFESKSVGFEGDNFYNLVVAFDTVLAPRALAARLRDIEHRHGRPAQVSKFSPRTLDLDLLLYGDLIDHGEGIDIPREDVCKYAFVLWPLAEMAGGERHPELGLTYTELWRRYDRDAPRGLWPVEIDLDAARGAA